MTGLLVLVAMLGQSPKILFIGNSHTAVNNVPDMVRRLLASDEKKRSAQIQTIGVSLLEQSGSDVDQAILSGHWDVVVLQGAQVSSSHKYRYRQDRAISLAKLALKGKARVLLCAEWPRRGWDESDYQLGVYREIQAAAKGSIIVPICKVWDASRKNLNGLDLWAADGNHANIKGSFLSACTIYRYLTEESKSIPAWIPNGVTKHEADVFHRNAIQTVKFVVPSGLK